MLEQTQGRARAEGSGLPPAVAAAGVLIGAGAAALLLWLSALDPAALVSAPGARFRLDPFDGRRDAAGACADAGVGPDADERTGSAACPPVSGPRAGRLAWRFRTGGRITGRPALDAAGATAYVASHDGQLYALAADGGLRWRRALGSVAYGGPLVSPGGRVIVGTDAGEVVAFSLAGVEEFRISVGAPVERALALGPGGLLLCAAGRTLIALAQDGSVAWRFTATGKIFGGPASDGRRIAFGTQDHRLHLLDGAGRALASVDLGADVDATPRFDFDGAGGVVVGADDGRLHALGADGRRRWSTTLEGRLRAPVAIRPAGAGDRLLAVSHGLRPRLHLIDARSGEVIASVPLGLTDSSEFFLRSGPLVGPGPIVYLGAPGQRILALDSAGDELFHYQVGGQVHATPTLAPDGTLYVGADDGVLYAFRD